ncbi:MAG: hypothetical protein K2M91_14615 [Lachnospiraceae bacterium]|nr:hypothetical protein [Lachnospiraceae bacterium]
MESAIEENELKNIEYAKQAECALTSDEARQITAEKRDKLYQKMRVVIIIFAVVSVVVMVGFKMNEGFFDASSRIGILMESINAQENNLSAPKVNVRTIFKDEEQSRLVIPLKDPISDENISIREEFTQNKYVITLSGYSESIPYGMELISDSTIMDAVGVYRQNDDIVVEVYCNDWYDYDLISDRDMLTLYFKDAGADYDASAVIWFPYEDRNRLALPEWRQKLEKFAADNHVKLYIAPDMQEMYTQEDVILFANRIHADMVLGVEVEVGDEQQPYMTGICNAAYFIPDFNSTHLSIVMAEAFLEETQIEIQRFEEEGSGCVLVSEATVPSAVIRISLAQKDIAGVENEYKMNNKIASALEKTMNNVFKSYIKMEEDQNEG